MILNGPVLMDKREEPIHLVRNILEVWRTMISDVNWLFTVTAAKLRNICHGRLIQSLERIFIERFDTFVEGDFNTVR